MKIYIDHKTVTASCPACTATLEINSGTQFFAGRDLLDTSIETCGRWAANHICGAVQARNDRTKAITGFFENIAGSIYRMSFKV